MATSRRSVGVVARLGLLLGASFFSVHASADDAELVAALQSGGHIALMRHSIAPGSNDPPDFRIADCDTQRNLSDGGRRQAAEIGAKLRTNGLGTTRVVSSQWCRCLDTASLLGVGDVEELPFLNSLVAYWGESTERTQSLHAWIGGQNLSIPTILVTHSVNINALLGRHTEEGEIVVVERADGGELRVVGSITP